MQTVLEEPRSLGRELVKTGSILIAETRWVWGAGFLSGNASDWWYLEEL